MYAISKMYILYVNLSLIAMTCMPSPYTVTEKHGFSNHLLIIITNSLAKKSVSFPTLKNIYVLLYTLPASPQYSR